MPEHAADLDFSAAVCHILMTNIRKTKFWQLFIPVRLYIEHKQGNRHKLSFIKHSSSICPHDYKINVLTRGYKRIQKRIKKEKYWRLQFNLDWQHKNNRTQTIVEIWTTWRKGKEWDGLHIYKTTRSTQLHRQTLLKRTRIGMTKGKTEKLMETKQ